MLKEALRILYGMIAKHYFGHKPKVLGVFCTFIRGQVDYTSAIGNLKAVVSAASDEEIFFFNEEINNYIDIARSTEVGEASKARRDYVDLSKNVLQRIDEM